MKVLQIAKDFYYKLIAIGDLFQHLLLFAIRLYWGFSFQVSGYSKLMNIKETTSFFSSLHIPFPEFNAYLAALTEFICGWLLMLGLGTRLAAIPLSIVMIVALFTAHREGLLQIFSSPSKFQNQSPVTFLLVTLTLFAFGPGAISLDYAIEKITSKK